MRASGHAALPPPQACELVVAVDRAATQNLIVERLRRGEKAAGPSGERRFPGELRLPGVATLVRVCARAELADRCRVETRYYISSASLDAKRAGDAVRGHWAIEKGHGARNMAVVRHFAINLVRGAKDKKSIKRRRKIAGWNPDFLAQILNHQLR